MRLSDESLRGRSVIASDGLAIGVIAGLILDLEAWRVDSLRVTLHKDVADRIGAGRTMFRPASMQIPTRLIQSVGDAVVLAVAIDELRRELAGAGASPAPH